MRVFLARWCRWLIWRHRITWPGLCSEKFKRQLFPGTIVHALWRPWEPKFVEKGAGNRQFILQHLQGTDPVLYSASGWLKGSREHGSIKNAISLLQDSSKEKISSLFIGLFARGGTIFCGSIAGMDGTHSLRWVSSIRRSFTSDGIKRNSGSWILCGGLALILCIVIRCNIMLGRSGLADRFITIPRRKSCHFWGVRRVSRN